jgi:hypothetical protein
LVLDTSHEWFGMVLKGINGLYVMKQAGFCVDESCGGFGLICFIYWGHNSGDQLTITAKPLLLNHHKCSWYLPWMIWDSFEGNQWTLC